MSLNIVRATTHLEGRVVHYRYAGSGPPVLLIHQSPQHSGAWTNLIARLADRYTLIAPDSPGFGYSDPLPGAQPEIADLAHATLEFCDAIGLDQFIAIGTHTGAAIAAEAGVQQPDRVIHLILDGYPIFNRSEREHILSGYFPDNPPRWDGGHLLWTWQRMREQMIFFPWFDDSIEARMNVPLPSPDMLHSQAMELLLAARTYQAGYAAAFRDDSGYRPAELKVPTAFLYRSSDILAPHAARLGALPAGSWTEFVEGSVSDMQDHIDRLLDQIAPTHNFHPAAAQIPARPGIRFANTAAGPLAMRHWPGRLNGRAALLIHDAGQSSELMSEIAAAAAPETDVWAPDLPGHGLSNELHPAGFDPQTLSRSVLEALNYLAVSEFDVIAEGAGCAVACALVKTLSAQRNWQGKLLLLEPLLLSDDEKGRFLDHCELPQPDEVGGHLLKTWQRIRDAQLVWPWFDGQGEIIRGATLAPEILQRRWLALWETQGHHMRMMAHILSQGHDAQAYADLPGQVSITRSAATTPGQRQKKLAKTNQYALMPDTTSPESVLRNWLS